MSKIFIFQAIQFSQTVLIQTIQFSISMVFVYTQLNVKTVLFQTIQLSIITVSMSKTVLFQTIQFSISTQFSSIWPIDRTISGATTSGQSGSGSDGNEGVLCIPQSSSITGASPSDCLESYLEHKNILEGVLALCIEAVSVFYSPSWLGNVGGERKTMRKKRVGRENGRDEKKKGKEREIRKRKIEKMYKWLKPERMKHY